MNEPNDPIPPPAIPPPDLPKPPPPVQPPPEPAVAVKIRQPGSPPPENPADKGVAPMGVRVVAALLDCLIAVGLSMAVLVVLPGFARMDERIGNLVAIAYLLMRDCLPFLHGRSVGKTAMKLRVVTETGAPLTHNWQAGIVRNIALIIPFFAIVELIVLLTREDKPERGRRLGDDWAKTKVVAEPDPAPPPAV